MQFADDGPEKRLTIPDRFDTIVAAILGADGKGHVRIENLHNVLHGPSHVLARGQTRYADGVFDFGHERTHALYSRFSWEAGP